MKFFDFLLGKKPSAEAREILLSLENSAAEYSVRRLAFDVCVNKIAGALGRCDFRTYAAQKETSGREWYLWNVEPNVNESSTEFIHHLIGKLCADNEALVISTRRRDGYDALVVADEWSAGKLWPSKQREYTGVRVGELKYDKTFRESEVLHFRWHSEDLKPVVAKMADAYAGMISAAEALYNYDAGQHWKVHVSQAAQGDKDYAENLQKMLEKQLRPFLTAKSAVLPEFDGWAYTDVGKRQEGSANGTTESIRKLTADVFDFTARGFGIPSVLVDGRVEGTEDAQRRFLTDAVDPVADMLQEEINRKRYGYEAWNRGDYLRVDTSAILHYDLLANAGNIEKLIESGAYTPNEVRRAMGDAKIPAAWADEYYMTLNIGSAGQAARQMSGE